MNKEKFLKTGLLEQYVLGLTDEEETKVVEEHLTAFPELREEVLAMHTALENYAKQYDIIPPKSVKDDVLKEIDKVESTKAKKSINQANSKNDNWRKWASYVALATLVAAYFFQAQRYNNVNAQLNEKNILLAECKSDNASLQHSQQVYAFITDTNTHPVLLKGTAISPASEALVYWNEPEQGAYFFASQLPEPPTDKQYQIWADVEGEMISIGLLDYQTVDLQQINYIANAESLNITLEPKGGSEHPNVAQLFVNAPIKT